MRNLPVQEPARVDRGVGWIRGMREESSLQFLCRSARFTPERRLSFRGADVRPHVENHDPSRERARSGRSEDDQRSRGENVVESSAALVLAPRCFDVERLGRTASPWASKSRAWRRRGDPFQATSDEFELIRARTANPDPAPRMRKRNSAMRSRGSHHRPDAAPGFRRGRASSPLRKEVSITGRAHDLLEVACGGVSPAISGPTVAQNAQRR